MKNVQPRRPLWTVLVALLMAGIACNLPAPAAGPLLAEQQTAVVLPQMNTATPTPYQPQVDSSPLSNTQTPAAPAPAVTPLAYQPFFEPAACAFDVPPGYDLDCGYLVVPENRDRPGGRTVRLHVAVFRSQVASPAPDPVIHLAGGPGSSALGLARYMFRQGLDGVLADRDLILFDQRGTGYSQPRLDCPEREALAPVLLEGSLPPGESSQAIRDSFRRCRERLEGQGFDLTAYNSAASAADVDDLRRALGYQQVNLYGVSYGTRLALTVLRDFPASVRSAVLDSTYPLQVSLYTALAPNAERAFERLFARCAEDRYCAAAYPDLRQQFYRLVDDLNTSPMIVGLQTSAGEIAVPLHGGLLIDVLFVGLYNPAVAASMPAMIYDLRQGDTARLRDRLLLYFDTSTALGMQMSVQCAEEISFNTLADAYAAAEGVQPQIAAFFPASVEPLFAACQDWHAAPPDPRENQPVSGSTPVLILAGELDPVTPPDWGRLVAGGFSSATFYEFPGHGHWVTRSSRCAFAVAVDFWQDPSQAPDASCLSGDDGLAFK